MASLSHKTTLLLTPEEHRLLLQEARRWRITMGEVIRRAIRKQLSKSAPRKNHKSWEKLFRMNAPSADWETMEQEILKERLAL